MGSGYRSFRLLLVNISYFYLLELLLTHNFHPGVAQGIEYLTWIACGIIIYFLAWLITNQRRAEVSAGLWLMALFLALWIDFHRQQLVGFGWKKLILILLPSLIFLVSFLLWLLGVTLERFQHLKNEMMISSLLVFPAGLLVYRQSLLAPGFNFGFLFGPVVFFAMVIASVLAVGLLLSFFASLRLIALSRLWLILVLPVALFALYGPVKSKSQQKMVRPKPASNLPDLILISVDALRQDHLGAYSAGKFTTPNFDRLAKDSLIFENAISASNWTLPAVASWLTGQWPHEHKAGKVVLGSSWDKSTFSAITHSLPTITERLKRQGYYTAAFVENDWFREFGFSRGFDYFFLFYPPELKPDLMGIKLFRAAYYLFSGRYQDPGAGWLTDCAIRWLKKNREQHPVFIWIHYFDPHLPYTAHREYPVSVKGVNPAIVRAVNRPNMEPIRSSYCHLTEQDKDFIHQRYVGEVIHTDLHFGRLLKFLEQEGRYSNAAIIFTADHGEEFWDHYSFSHGQSFYQELIKVPLFIKLPGNKNQGKRISIPVSTAQIYSTLLALANQKPENFPDLISIAESNQNSLEYFFSEFPLFYHLKGAILNRELKKIILGPAGEKIYFDLVIDPKEKNPLPASEIPPALLNLDLPSPGTDLEKASISPETRRNLEALGYLK